MPYQSYGPVMQQQQYVPMQYQQNMVPAPQQQQQPFQGISPSSRVVSSREEANAVPADFSGIPIIMPMYSNGELSAIYVKQWNIQQGQSMFGDFIRPAVANATKDSVQEQRTESVVGMQDYQSLLDTINNMQDIIDTLQNGYESLHKEIERIKKPVSPTAKATKKERTDTDAE